MKYMLICCIEETKLSPAFRDETAACCAALQRSGYLMTAEVLEPVDMAVTVRVRNGRLSVTGGALASTAEPVGGILLISARDLNEAIDVAAKFPSARLGNVEIRPVLEVGGKP